MLGQLHRPAAVAALLNHRPDGGVNEAGLRAVVAQIELDPTAWNQEVYIGSSQQDPRRVAYCFAAWTCLLAGYDVEGEAQRGYTIPRIAEGLLGLTRREANQLFFWGTGVDEPPTVEQLKTRLTEITGISFATRELATAGA